LNRIKLIYDNHSRAGGPKLDKESLGRLSGRLRECLISCMENGLDIHNPPPRFLDILKDFRNMGAIQTIGLALSSLGLGAEAVNDLLESELYCCMIYQLHKLNTLPNQPYGRSPFASYIPPELRYTTSPSHYSWSGYLAKISVNISDINIPDKDMSDEHTSDEDMSDEDMSDEDISDEDLVVEDTSGETKTNSDACYPQVLGLAEEGFPVGAWQDFDRKVFSAAVRSHDFGEESEQPTKRIRLSTQPIEEVRDGDDASSTMSSLLDAFDAEYQDNFHHKQNSIQGNSTNPITSEIIAICGTSTFATVDDTEKDMNSDDSCDERLDGLTIALNAFWT
jgi:hypothetical protein